MNPLTARSQRQIRTVTVGVQRIIDPVGYCEVRTITLCAIPLYWTPITDRDGWGWDWISESTCFVDNTSVETNYTVTDASGTATTGMVVAPIVGRYVKSPGNFSSALQISSDGTLYHFRVPDRSLASTDSDGNTLWLVRMPGDTINRLVLNEAEDTLYATLQESGRIASYNTDGIQNWASDKLGDIGRMEVGKNAIIAGLRDDSDQTSNRLVSVVSLNFNGTLRWRFEPGGDIDQLAHGRDNRVYVKYLSEPHGNETTFILEE